MSKLENVSYLWENGEKSEWGLVWVKYVKAYAIIHIDSGDDLIIEDDEIYEKAVEKMLEANVPIFKSPYS